MISAHLPTAEGNCQILCCRQQPHEPKCSRRGVQRSGRSLKRLGPCFASSQTPPETCIELPEPSSRYPSCSIRKRLEYIYQLEQPQQLWSSAPAHQQIAKQGCSVNGPDPLQVQLCESPPESTRLKDPDSKRKQDDYYANVGQAIRTLRDETPYFFQQNLSCECFDQHHHLQPYQDAFMHFC